ncbi:MAG TPA: hypothetical protein VF753_18875 [Terriglobales bacterium]
MPSIIRWPAFIAALLALVLTVGVFLSNRRRELEARGMLTLARNVRLGATTLSELSQAAAALRVNLDVRTYKDPGAFAIQKASMGECASKDCVIFLGSAPWGEHGLLYNLQIKSKELRKWLPWNDLSVALPTADGIVKSVEIQILSVNDARANMASSTIRGDRVGSPWRILRNGGSMEGPGEVVSGMDRIEIEATADADPSRRAAALDFDVSCMRLTRHCSPCGLLPFACEDYDHGDWYYFEMSGELLRNLQVAVNGLPMGSPKSDIESRLGFGGLTNKELFDDKLPYRFPDGTMFEESEPTRLIYYVKKWREEHEGSPQDQTVTLAFDKQERLASITSQVGGISSR